MITKEEISEVWNSLVKWVGYCFIVLLAWKLIFGGTIQLEHPVKKLNKAKIQYVIHNDVNYTNA